jgi:hypothetical protein
MVMDVEAEIRDLKRRVGELEGSFGFLTEQVKGIHRDLLGFQARTEARFDKVEAGLGAVQRDVGAVQKDVGTLRKEVSSLRKDLPEIVGNAVRDVLRPDS